MSGSLIAVVSTSVFATDTGVVNFNGKIVADTCEINVNESASTTGTVTFADTYPADYSGDGSIGTSKDFKIELIKMRSVGGQTKPDIFWNDNGCRFPASGK